MKDLYFIYNGKNLSFKNNDKISDFNYKNITIIVFNLNDKKENKGFNQIICPDCKEMSMINFIEDKISIKNCFNKHINNFSIKEFMKKQYINELKCNICKNDKYLYNDKFNICSCKQFICPLCAISHDKSHNMIEYNDRFYKCIKHNNIFISYCNSCNINLCEKCEENHDNKHKRISYKEKKPNEKKLNEIKKEIKEIEKKIKRYKMEINKLNNLFVKNMNNIINDLDNYILLYENIYNSIDNLNNYESINNLNNFKNKKLIKEIDDFINENIKNKYKRIIENIWNSKNEMTIIYENNNKIKLFGEIFIENNK